MKKFLLLLAILIFNLNAICQTTTPKTVTQQKTLIKSNHNFGLTNPVHDANSPMTYIESEVDAKGGAFILEYKNQGGTSFDGYPSGSIGGFKANNTYYSGNKTACGLPVQIKDLTDSFRINWKTSQTNANDTDDKWWATINVIFDGGAETAQPDVTTRDYDLVIQNVSYKQDDFADFDNPGGRYWYFARNSDANKTIKPFTVYLDGVAYSWAIRYKFFDYPAGHKNVDKNDKVHIKFIPIDNSTPIPNLDHSLKQFIDATKDYLEYLPLSSTEETLANQKVAESTLWIKSITAGYEIYEGTSTLANDYFYSTIDTTAPNALTNVSATEQSGDISLSWSASTDDAFDTYIVYRSENGGAYTEIKKDLRTNSYVDTSVPDGAYNYYITAKDRSFNESTQSNIVAINLGSTLNSPTNTTATAADCSTISLTWDDNSTEEDGYKITRSINGSAYTLYQTLAANTTSYTSSQLTENTAYAYRVKAFDASGNSSADQSNTVATPSCQTTSTIYVNDDAHVRNGTYKNTNYGTNSVLQIRQTNNQNAKRMTYLKFNLNGATNITSAILRVNNTGSNGDVYVKEVSNNSWNEGTLEWQGKPSLGSTIGTYNFTATGFYDIDVTNYVIAQSSGDGNASFALKGVTSNLMSISSKESGNGAQLIITHIGSSASAKTSNQKSLAVDTVSNDFDKIIVYPNPTNSFVNIKIPNLDNKDGKVQVFDVAGRLIQSQQITSASTQIDLEGPTGIYILKIQNNDTVTIKKVVKR
ncbi:T9SS type A sorting domain-containing protein [Polaribacter haliotis]|uniref:T9SS type A sorting domain-containing protein n=1 Tax=Polaribacter haliotis TaxID=1888915 RepID=A0A7L8AJ17_9FLAO|nr:T9SS type A sorting domain-containing protein [Polaribacter haliotis]QOD61973.1 T9SS type A sorting domain-containing protein [Polaribacter haliotis]